MSDKARLGKQIRVSDVVYEEIKRLVAEYDLDKRSIMSASMVLWNSIVEHDAKTIELLDKDGNKVSMPVPLLFKKQS